MTIKAGGKGLSGEELSGKQPPRKGLPRNIRVALLLAAALAAAVILGGALTQLLFQAALACMLAWMASPLCVALEKHFKPGLAALLAMLSFLAAAGGLLWLLLPQLFAQAKSAAAAIPALIDLLQGVAERLGRTPLLTRIGFTGQTARDMLLRFGEGLMNAVPGIAKRMAGGADKLLRAFLAPVLAYYFLRDRETFCFQWSLWIPLKYRRRTLAALREMRREVSGYFRGQMLVSGAVAVLTAIGLLIVGVPSWLLLGVIMGVCDLIPYAGPYLGAVPIVLFSLPQGVPTTLWAVATVAAVQQAESLFLSPRLMAGATGLHPAYVLLLLSAGGLLAGLPGMLLALPFFVCARGAARALRCAADQP